MGSSLPAMLTKRKSYVQYVQNQKTLHLAPAQMYLFLFPEVKFHHHALRSTLEDMYPQHSAENLCIYIHLCKYSLNI